MLILRTNVYFKLETFECRQVRENRAVCRYLFMNIKEKTLSLKSRYCINVYIHTNKIYLPVSMQSYYLYVCIGVCMQVCVCVCIRYQFQMNECVSSIIKQQPQMDIEMKLSVTSHFQHILSDE